MSARTQNKSAEEDWSRPPIPTKGSGHSYLSWRPPHQKPKRIRGSVRQLFDSMPDMLPTTTATKTPERPIPMLRKASMVSLVSLTPSTKTTASCKTLEEEWKSLAAANVRKAIPLSPTGSVTTTHNDEPTPQDQVYQTMFPIPPTDSPASDHPILVPFSSSSKLHLPTRITPITPRRPSLSNTVRRKITVMGRILTNVIRSKPSDPPTKPSLRPSPVSETVPLSRPRNNRFSILRMMDWGKSQQRDEVELISTLERVPTMEETTLDSPSQTPSSYDLAVATAKERKCTISHSPADTDAQPAPQPIVSDQPASRAFSWKGIKIEKNHARPRTRPLKPLAASAPAMLVYSPLKEKTDSLDSFCSELYDAYVRDGSQDGGDATTDEKNM
ncbi:hypothetical protein DFS34DRAFT_628686, partial [Phlyctochytrium arcticum]